MKVMIGVDPHKGSHTAVAIDDGEDELVRRSISRLARRLSVRVFCVPEKLTLDLYYRETPAAVAPG
ncbi:MAG: hypothetical protein ACT4PI_04255 [Actinomycetota bacterium]